MINAIIETMRKRKFRYSKCNELINKLQPDKRMDTPNSQRYYEIIATLQDIIKSLSLDVMTFESDTIARAACLELVYHELPEKHQHSPDDKPPSTGFDKYAERPFSFDYFHFTQFYVHNYFRDKIVMGASQIAGDTQCLNGHCNESLYREWLCETCAGSYACRWRFDKDNEPCSRSFHKNNQAK